MRDQFDWQFSEDEQDSVRTTYGRWSLIAHRSWILAGTILIAILGGWYLVQQRQQRITEENIRIAQRHIDLEYKAYHTGDGDLFFSLQANDPAWFSAQLRPENLAFFSGSIAPQITQADALGDNIWANAQWRDDAGIWQRLVFLEQQDSGWVHVLTNDEFWENTLVGDQEWGRIRYYGVDETWIPSIVAYVDNIMADVCPGGCDREQPQFLLDVRSDFADTAAPDQINIPSPRLIGLDDKGQPSPAFWRILRQRIEDRLTPTTIRFVIPPPRSGSCCRNLDYESAAAEFMRQNPDIKVELVAMDTLTDDLSTLTIELDGAAIPPTTDMVAAGSIFDLTDFATSDPEFDAGDFYEHVWQGALWRERLWFMPLTAEFQLLYYDKEAFSTAGIPGPNLFWQWEEIDKNGPYVLAAQPEYSSLTWQFLDLSRDSLFAYAYSLADSCPDTIAPPCFLPLQPHHIAGALGWYRDQVENERIPNMAQQTDGDRVWFLNNFQSAQRHALMWVDEPIRYEYYQLLDPVGVVPFPGVERIEGVTPIWVDGAFINSQSQRPYATWLWLKFLSYQPPDRSYRLVPARPSVAGRINYWPNLPRPLVNAMRTAYTFSRPVTLPERDYFEWAKLEEVISGARTPIEISQQPPPIKWFGQ